MDYWTDMGGVCCAYSRSTSPEKHRLHRVSKTLSVTASPYGSKYSALHGISVEDSMRVIQTVLPGPIKANSEQEEVFPNKPLHPSPQRPHGVYAELTAPRHTQLVCSTL
jgi:hypothetical protein